MSGITTGIHQLLGPYGNADSWWLCPGIYITCQPTLLHSERLANEVRRTRREKWKGEPAVGEHLQPTGHTINIEDCSIFATESERLRRKIKEVIYTYQHAPSPNRDSSYELPPIYRDLLSRKSTRHDITWQRLCNRVKSLWLSKLWSWTDIFLLLILFYFRTRSDIFMFDNREIVLRVHCVCRLMQHSDWAIVTVLSTLVEVTKKTLKAAKNSQSKWWMYWKL